MPTPVRGAFKRRRFSTEPADVWRRKSMPSRARISAYCRPATSYALPGAPVVMATTPRGGGRGSGRAGSHGDDAKGRVEGSGDGKQPRDEQDGEHRKEPTSSRHRPQMLVAAPRRA